MATTRKQQREAARAERQARERAEAERQLRQRRMWQLGGALVLAAAIVVAAIAISSSGGGSGGSSKGAATDAAQVNGLLAGIPQQGQVLGNPNAPVTLTEFADLQCPFCKQYTLSEFPTIVNKYVRPGKVKVQFQNLTFIGPDSVTAALAAAGAGEQNKLWTFQDLWYHNQGEENTGYVTDAFIRKIASGVQGLDVNRLMSDRNNGAAQQQVSQAQALMTQMHVSSTPTFFIQRAGAAQTEVTDQSQLQSALDKAVAGK